MSEPAQTPQAPARPLYERVQQLLRVREMTMSTLAKQARVARGTIYNWRTNEGAPDDTTVLRVARVLGLDRDEALRLAGLPPLPDIDTTSPTARDETPPDSTPGRAEDDGVDVLADLPDDPAERIAELGRRLDKITAEARSVLGGEQGRRRSS